MFLPLELIKVETQALVLTAAGAGASGGDSPLILKRHSPRVQEEGSSGQS